MDCHSDFFSLLSLSQLNNATTVAACASFTAPPAAGIAPSLNQLSYSNGHRLKNGAIEMSAATHSLGLGPVLVANHCSVNEDVDMIVDGPVSMNGSANGHSMSCRHGIKRKRDCAQQLALGDDAEMRGGADWAAMPNGHSPQVDVDLQPEKQKRICSESHHGVFHSHHHPFTSLSGHNNLLSLHLHNNTNHSASVNHLHPHNASAHPLLNGVEAPSSRNTFAHQKLNLCTAGISVLEEEAGSSMHIHVPGVSVTECPRCLAGEPVYPTNTGAYGTLQSIFEPSDSHDGHQMMTTD